MKLYTLLDWLFCGNGNQSMVQLLRTETLPSVSMVLTNLSWWKQFVKLWGPPMVQPRDNSKVGSHIGIFFCLKIWYTTLLNLYRKTDKYLPQFKFTSMSVVQSSPAFWLHDGFPLCSLHTYTITQRSSMVSCVLGSVIHVYTYTFLELVIQITHKYQLATKLKKKICRVKVHVGASIGGFNWLWLRSIGPYYLPP